MADQEINTAQAINALEMYLLSFRAGEHMLGVLKKVQRAEQDVQEAHKQRAGVVQAIEALKRQLAELNTSLENVRNGYQAQVDRMAEETSKSVQDAVDAAGKAIAEYHRQTEAARNSFAVAEGEINRTTKALSDRRASLQADVAKLEAKLTDVSERLADIAVKSRGG